MELLLAERLSLAALDPKSGRTSYKRATSLAPALAGPLLMDLLFRDAAVLRDGRLDWVRALGDPRKKLLARLVERGVPAERAYRVLWFRGGAGR